MSIANIGPRQRAWRRRLGYLSIVLAVAGLAAMSLSGRDRTWRLLLFFPFLGGAYGVLQAREKT
jgi:hypothetical protein